MFATLSHCGARTASIPAGSVSMPGTLTWPEHPSGFVLFAHDTGSGQFCPRDRYIAARMCHEGLATLQVDLLTPREAGNPVKALDMALLARRIRAAAAWLEAQPESVGLPLGICGFGTGAAAAMLAAAEAPDEFKAMVMIGARADLVESAWPAITIPTLLIVGSKDLEALTVNHEAMAQFTCPAHLIEVANATRELGERSALAHAAGCATDWFVHHLANHPAWQASARMHHSGRRGP